ncbi:MAG: thioredoxin family protein [Verrucomicrobiales bacterium]
MAATPSTLLLPLGTPLPSFDLPDGTSVHHCFDRANGRPTVVIFACNHCPYVVHLAPAVGAMAREFAGRVDFFAINSNDVKQYPEDRAELMPDFAAENGWSFPYLADETQDVAVAYGAACTPDFFVGDREGRLFYRGQFDDSRPARSGRPEIQVDGRDLRAALMALLGGGAAPASQFPSLGCNIKWRLGREPTWFQTAK